MTQEKSDKLLREKINALDLLSGGIVFGKEDAWEKLQQRMEHKPARKIALKYPMAAAAVLLLFIFVVVVYNSTPSKEVVNNDEKISNPTDHIAADQQPPAAVAVKPENVIVEKTIPVIEKRERQAAKAHEQSKETNQPVITVVQQLQTTLDENKIENKIAIINQPAPVTLSIKPMKTIHINDLDKTDPEPFIAAIFTGVDLEKLPIVNINEVIHEEYEVRRILKENRWSFMQTSFKHGYNYDNSTETDGDTRPPYSLKVRFNPKN